MHNFRPIQIMNRHFTGFEFEARKCMECGYVLYDQHLGLGEFSGMYGPDCNEYLIEQLHEE